MGGIVTCTTYRNVTLTFTPPAVVPSQGYRVKWRVVGNPTYEVYPTLFPSSPILIEGVQLCNSIEFCIEVSCAPNVYGPLICIVVPPQNEYCVSFTSETGTEPSTECSDNDEYIDYTFTLRDNQGNIVNAPSDVTISYSGTIAFQGGGGTYNGSATITTGQSSVVHRIWTYQTVNGEPACPCPCPTTISINESSFSPSIALPDTVTMCTP